MTSLAQTVRRGGVIAALLALLLMATRSPSAGQTEPTPPERGATVPTVAQVDPPPNPPPAKPAPVVAQPNVPVENRYWIGVRAAPATPALRSQLRLGDAGLVVDNLTTDLPAHRAGLLRNDVLLEATEHGVATPLRTRQDLVRAINAAGTDPITFRLLREGQEQTIELRPVLRPVLVYGPHHHHHHHVHTSMSSLEELLLLSPVVVLPVAASASPVVAHPLPENVMITVTRTGGQPTRIVVRRGDEHWDIAETELHRLPTDLQPYVSGHLGVAAPRIVTRPLP
jgi:hypothetical protein